MKLFFLSVLVFFGHPAFSQPASAPGRVLDFITSDGVRLYVRTTGQSNPCVFVHGGPGITSYIFEATTAARLVEKNLMMVYFDQRGCGRSAWPADGDSVKPDQQISHFNQMIQVHQEPANKGIEYKIMFRSQHEKDVEDSLLNATSTHFNWDFQHRAWTLPDYGVDYSVYTKYIVCPVLIISGTTDYAVGPNTYKTWHFKNSQVVIYNGAHTSYQEEPEWFAEQVGNFMNGRVNNRKKIHGE